MRIRLCLTSTFLIFAAYGLVAVGAGRAGEPESARKVDMNIDVNKEDRDVGLKRMELNILRGILTATQKLNSSDRGDS